MPTGRSNGRAAKLNRSYEVAELAELFGVHKNTVREWQRQGLQPIDDRRPALFNGGTIRQFLKDRQAARKRPCPPGTLYCCRCRKPQPPALSMVDYVARNDRTGEATALCEVCGCVMNRSISLAQISMAFPHMAVRFTSDEARLSLRCTPSVNIHFEAKDVTP